MREDFIKRLWLIIEKKFEGKWTLLAKEANISPGSFKRYLDGTAKPGFEQLIRICETAGVNPTWLLTGEGPMFRQEKEVKKEAREGVKPRSNARLIELREVPVVARVGAGFPHLNFDDVEVLYYILLPADRYHKNAFAVEVSGDSMEPVLTEGDVVVCEPFSGFVTDIPNSKIVVIANSSGELLIKRIKKFISPDYSQVKIIFYSDNPKYPPIDPQEEEEEYRIIGIAVEVVQRRKL